MSKIAIVTDSNSGITQNQVKELPDVFVLSMPFMIDHVTYYEDVTLSQELFYQKLSENADIITSQPNPSEITSLWDSLLMDYDEIVHIPMSSGLSGSCQTAHMLSAEYEGKVQVVNNQRISVTQKSSVLDAVHLAEAGKNAAEIKTILEADKFNSSIYITLNTLYYLRKGGRITPAAAALGTILRLKPVLQIQGERLDAFAKARTMSQAKSIMSSAIKSDSVNRFHIKNESEMDLYVVHSANESAAFLLKEELKEEFPGYRISVDRLSLSIACHIGPGALAIACTKKLDYEKGE